MMRIEKSTSVSSDSLGYFGEPRIQWYQAFLEKGICHTVEDAGTLPERLMLDIGLKCEEATEGVK